MRLSVKTLTGKTYSIDAETTDTIYFLKEKIENNEGVPINMQRLIYDGKQRKDEDILKDLGIKHKSTLHLILRGRGC